MTSAYVASIAQALELNSSINPKINSSINPKISSTINPKISVNIDGKYYFNVDGDFMAILVPAGDGIFLRFDTDMEWTGYAVPNGEGLALFNLDGDWNGYFVGNSAGEYNLFDLDGECLASRLKVSRQRLQPLAITTVLGHVR